MSGQSDRPKKRVLRIQDHYSLPCEDSSRRRSRSSSPQKYFIDDEDEDGNENYPEFRRADEGRRSYASREDYGRRSNSPGTSGGYRRRLSVGDDDEDAFRHRKGYSYEEKYEHKLRNYEEMRSHEEDYRRLSPRRSSDYERTRLRDSIGEGSSSKFGGGYEERRSLGTFEKHEKNPFQFHNDYEEFLQSENFEHQSGGSYERQLMQDYDRQPIRDYEGLRVRDYEGQSAEDYFEDHRKERRLEEFEERRPYSREGSEEGRIRNLRSSRERSIDYNNLPFERSHDNKLRRGSHERTRDNELRRESHERSRDSELRRRSRERSRDNISRRLSRQRSHDSRSPGASHEIISRFPHERSRDPDTRRRSRERSRDEINRSRRSRSREKSRDRTDRFPRRRYRDSPPRRHSRENSREVVNRRLSRRRSRDSPQERRSREILRSRRSSEDERLGTSPRGDLEEESSADLRNFIRKKKSTKQLNPGENILMRRHLRENYATSISPTSSRSRSRDKSETNFYFGGDEKDSENIADLHKSPERNSAGSDQEDDPVWDRKESYAVRRLSNLIKNSPTYEKCLKIRDEVEASTSEEYREPYFLPQYSPKDMGDEDESEGIFDLEPPLESTSTRSSKEDKLWDRKSRKEDRGWNSKEDKLRSEKAVREEKFRSDKISEDELRSRRTSREDKLKSERSAREDKFRSERSARESQRPMREDKPRSEGSTREDKLRRERSTREDELKSERMRRGDMLRSERSTREDELKSERIRGEDKSRSERSTREDELKSERSRREDKLRNERSTREDELKSGRTRREDKIRSERSRKEDVIKSERLRKEDKLQNQKSSREESLQCREGSKEDTLRNQNVSVLGRTTTGRQNEPRHDEELSKSRSKIAPTSQKSSSITSKSSIPKSNYSKGPLIASTPSVTTPQHISSISTSNTTKPPLISQRPISTIVNIETYPRGNQQQQRPAFNTSNSPMMNVQQGPPFMSPNSSMVQQRPSFTSPNSSMELQQRLPIICSSPQMIGLQQQPLISSAPYTTMNRPLLMTPNLQISPQHIPPGQQILNFQTRPYHIPQQNSYPQIPQMTQRPPFIPSGPTPMNLQYRHFNPTINLTIPRLNPPTSNYSQRPVLMNNQQIRTSATANRQTTLKDLTGNKKPVPTPTIVKQINQDNQPQSIANLFGDEILKQNILGKKPKIVNRKTPSIANPVVSPNQKKLGGNVAGLRSGKTAQVSPMKGSVVLKDSPKALAMKKQDRFRQLNDLKRRAQKIDFTEDEIIYQVKPKVPVYSFPKYSDNVKTVKGSSNAPKKSCQDIKKEATKTSKGNETNSTMNSPKSKDSCGKLLKSTDSVKLKTPTGKRLNDVQVNSNNHKKQKTDDSKQEMTNAEMVADILSVIINNASKADNLFTKEIVTTEITNISGDKPNDEVENLELVSDESVSEHKSKRSRKKKGECWLMKRRLRRIEFNKKKKLEKSMGINIVKPGNSKSAQNKTEMKESDIVSTIIENSTAGKENLSCDQELSAENIVANIISSVINKATKVDDSFSEDFEDVTENLENEDFSEPNVSTSVKIPLKKSKRKSLRNILRGRKRRSHYRKKNKGKKESSNAEVATPKTKVVHRDTSKVLSKKVRSNRKSAQNKMDDIASPIMNQEAQIEAMVTDVSSILNNSAEANKSSVKNLETQVANETSVANENVIIKDSETENNSRDLSEVSEIFTREVTSEIIAGDIISSILSKATETNNFSIQESREKNLQVHEKAILEKITEESQEKTIKETREKITEDETTQKSQEESTQEKTTEDETTLESQEESTRESQVEKKEETTLESQKESTQESQVETIGKPQEKSTENPQEIITRESREKQKNDDDSKQEVSNEEMVADILSAITNNATKVNNLFTEEIITTEETNISGDEVQNENMTTDIISTNTDNAFDEVGNLELVSDESVSEQKKRRSTKSRGKNWLMKRRLRRAEFNKKKRREKSMGINFSGVANIQKPQEKKLQVHEEKAIRKKTAEESQEKGTEEHEEEITPENHDESTRESEIETIRESQENTTEEHEEETARESQEESTQESRVETIREPQEITTEEHEEDETIRESQDESIKEFQVETIRDPQEKTTEENEEETARESQEECTRESQVETIQESQEKTTEEHEEQTTRESQEECTQEYQIETIPEPGEKNTRESQEEIIRESQEECTQEYQIETIPEPRKKITQESQEETIREPQEKNTQEFNEGSIREPHKKIAVEAQEGATEEPQVKSNEGFQKEISREYHEETTCEVQKATTQEPKEIISQDQREKGDVSENLTETENMLLDSVPIKTASITAAAQNSGEIEMEEARFSKNLTQNEENAAADIISSIIEADISGDTNLDTFLDSVLVQISSIAASNLSARKSKEVNAEVTKSQENVAADAMNKSTEVSSFGEGLDQNVREKNLEGENVLDNVTEIKEIDVPKNLTEIEENDVSKNTTEIEENDVSKTTTEIEEKDVSKNLTEIKESDVSKNTTEIEENVSKNYTEIKESDVSKNATEIEENDVSTNITEIEENDISKNTTEIEENDVSKNTTEIEENNVSENLTGIEENVVADVISAIIIKVTETNITPFNPAENIEDTKFSTAVGIVEDSSLNQEVSNENLIVGILTTILKNATGGNDDLLGEEQKSLEINQITDFINDSFEGDVSPTNKERLQKSDEPSTKKQGLQKTDEPSIKKQGLQKTDEPSIKKQKLQIIDEPLTKKRALQKTDKALTDKEPLQKSDEPSTKKQLLQVDNKSKSVESPTTDILSELDSIESNPKNVDTSRDAILNPDIFVVEKEDLNSEKGDKKIEDSGDLISKSKNVVVVSNIMISPPRPGSSSKHQEKIVDIFENSAEEQDASTENVIAGILSAIINNITKESDLLIRKENDLLSFKEQDHFEDESAENVVMGILSTVINNSTKADESLIENDGNNSFDRICKEIKIGDDNLNLNQEESTEKVVADIISNIIYRVTRKNRVRSKNKNKSKSFNKAKSERMVRQIIWEIIDKVDTSGNAGQNVYGNGGKRGQIFNAIVSHFTKSTPTQNKKSKQNKPSTSSSVIPSTSAYPPQVGYNQLPLPNVSLFPYAANRVGLLPFPAPPIQNRKRKINEPIQNSPKMKPLHYSTVVNPIPSTSTPKKLSKKRRKRMRKAALAAAQTKSSPSKQANDEISAESESEEIGFKKKKSNTSFSDEEMKKYGVEIVLSPHKSINIRNHVFRSRRQDTVPEIYRKPMDNSTGLNFFTRNTYIKHMFL